MSTSTINQLTLKATVDGTEIIEISEGGTGSFKTTLSAVVQGYQLVSEKGAANGYAGLDASQQLLLANFPSGTALQVLRRNAANTALEFATVSGGSGITSINGDTTAAQILAGTANRLTINDAGATHTFDIATTYVGQSSITTLGTITSGVWNGTAITYANLDLANSILNADIATGAAIAFSKMASLTINRALVSDGSGVVAVSAVTSTELGFVSGVTSSIQTQIDGKENSLGFTPENAANKGAISGYAGLDASQELLLTNFPSGTALQVLRRNAGNTALEFADVAAGGITSINGDTTAAQIIAGTTNRITVADAGATHTIDIAATYVGQTSITTLGTIATGVWNGTTIAIANGGSGETTQQAAINALTNVAAATNEHVLTKDTATGDALWKVSASGFPDPMTTIGDIIIRDGTNTTARLGIGANGQVLKVSAGLPVWTAEGGGVAHEMLSATHTDTLIGTVSRGSIIAGNATPLWAELVIGTANQFLQSDGTDLGYVTLSGDASLAAGVMTIQNDAITTVKIADDNVTYAKIQNVVGNLVVLGNISGAGGIIEELNGTDVTALLDVFTDLLQGVVPASGGGTVNFLRADGTWAPPPGGGGGITTLNTLTATTQLFAVAEADELGISSVTATHTFSVGANIPRKDEANVFTASQTMTELVITNAGAGANPTLSSNSANQDLTILGNLDMNGQDIILDADGDMLFEIPQDDLLQLTVPAVADTGFQIVHPEGTIKLYHELSNLPAPTIEFSLDGGGSAQKANMRTLIDPGADVGTDAAFMFEVERTVGAAIQNRTLFRVRNSTTAEWDIAANGDVNGYANTWDNFVVGPLVTGIDTVNVVDDAITYAKMQNVVANNVFLGNNSGAGGIVDELTGTEATVLLDVFGASLKGLVPAAAASPDSTKYLSEDGTFTVPAAEGGGSGCGCNATAAQYVPVSTTIGDYTSPASATLSSTAPNGTTATNSASGRDDSSFDGAVWASRVDATALSEVVAVQVNVFSGTGNVIIKLYDDVAGEPTNLLGETVSTVSAVGLNTIPLTTTVSIPANNLIWVGLQSDSGTQRFVTETTVVAASLKQSPAHTFDTPGPDPFGTPTNFGNALFVGLVEETFIAANAIDGDLTRRAQSTSEVNPDIVVDMGSPTEIAGIALHRNAADTTTQIAIAVSDDDVTYTDVRLADISLITAGSYVYATFNRPVPQMQYVRIRGTAGVAQVLSYDDIQVRSLTESQYNALHKHNTISPTDATLPLDGTLASECLVPIPFIIDGGGQVITAGIKGDVEVPFDGTIRTVRMLSRISGSIVVDVLKDTYANYPSSVSIAASAKPTLTSQFKSEDITLDGWTTNVTKGDIISFEVEGTPTSVERVTCSLVMERT